MGASHLSRPGLCMTPGAVYGTKIKGNRITLTIDVPNGILALSARGEKDLIANIHAALLGPIEGLFKKNWKALRGKPDEDGKPFPKQWWHLQAKGSNPMMTK